MPTIEKTTTSEPGAEAERRVLASVPAGVFVAGEWRAPASGRTFEVTDPATELPLTAAVADGGPGDAAAALEAAVAAQDGWAATAARERAEILRRAFDALVARTDDLALLITLEMGKPLPESRAEVAYAAEFLRWFSEQAAHVGGGYRAAPGGGQRLITHRQPVGPSLLITPWNFPLAMGTRKVGAAVAAGCTMVLKPAELTPLASFVLADVLAEAGLPPGVLNVVSTTDPAAVVAPLLADPRLRKLSFTGSTDVGALLLRQAADNVLRTSMELGGNAPLIVFDDADLDAAIEGTLLAKMRNMGQSCVAANRVFVHESVAGEYAERLTAGMTALRVGRGTEPGTDVGPLIDARQRNKVGALVDDAVAHGAVLHGGGPRGDVGFFYAPAVLTEVPGTARLTREEIFGPVAAVSTFREEQEVVAAANDTRYGLVGYVFTRDLARALRVGEQLETGMVGINQGLVSNPAGPFGGVKHSGLGREGGDEGIEEYLEVKYLAVAG
ncbi:NAD-dependent succinate-semialdehyde dehydrogenase [Prauserella muralis]|uniref:NAD-dependent succinate-semialdehyde dehydrogenase n=1 Tax=Prauserella muralis TaxID=588067 RepID=A0A2V4ATX1_9PSEU|nr:NAD-dependent succinate-semialdehyde dehydrogenase [Prauserella muralis]PXY24728.1 NAD-dependent succinate-semialdehyde dehydrogenase [Prauserella muralis]TWE27654.1 succinate-semialdehyde dehydrogenase/glutarate-semialdehyde dehydrogenase [Prauserella muralis]